MKGQVIIMNPQEGQSIEDYVKHDFSTIVKNPPKSISWENNQLLVISFDQACYKEKPESYAAEMMKHEIESFADKISLLGFNVFNEFGFPVVRNEYLALDDFMVSASCDDKGLTRSPSYVFGKGFVIASDSLIKNYTHIEAKKRDENSFLKEETIRKFWDMLGVKRIYFVPPAKKTNNVSRGTGLEYNCERFETIADVDNTIGSIPWLNIYTVDEEYYREQENVFKDIERKENIEFLIIPPTQIRVPELRIDGTVRIKNVDLWVNAYLALKKQENKESDFETHIFYSPFAETLKDLIANKFFKHNRGSYYYGRPTFTTIPLPLFGNSLYDKTLHCFTHTAPDLETYKKFRKIKGWDK